MNLKRTVLLLICTSALFGCSSYRKSLYMRHDEVLDMVSQKGQLYEARIMPKDELTITVSTSDPASSAPFYRKIGQSKDQQNTQGTEGAKLLSYLVDKEGYIDYPILGKLHVAGLSNRECEAMIRKKLEAYLNEVPNVTVRTSNYKVSVLGEVNKPGTYTISDEQITIFQALAEAGDMTLFADRDNVKLLREDATGKRQIVHLDLTEADITLSPYYYLQQNDIVYIQPTKGKVRSNKFNNNGSIWISLLSLASTVASLIIVALN